MMAAALAARNVSANMISIVGMLVGILGGIALYAAALDPIFLEEILRADAILEKP